MRRKLIVVTTAVLSGCGMNQNAQFHAIGNAANETRQQEFAACAAKFPPGVRGKSADNVRCTNAANAKFHRALPGNTNIDLIDVANTQAVVAAEKYDSGLISKAEFDAEMAQIASRTKQAFSDRDAQASNTYAMQQQAAAARQQAAMGSIAAGAAIMAPPQPSNTSCTTFGDTVNCRHY